MALALLVLAPFYDKAYTIDDPTFIGAADYVHAHPRHPAGFSMVQDGVFVQFSWLRYLTTAYLLWPAAALHNAEWAAHAVMIFLFLLALWATAALALRLGLDESRARVAALLLATSPAALVMASTAMPDIPALALGVIAVERTCAWRSERRWHQALAAALLLVAATLARSHAGLLVGVCALALWDADGDATRFLPVVIAASLLVVAGLASRLGVHSEGLGVTWGLQPLSNTLAYGVHLVLTVPLAGAWLLLKPRRTLAVLFAAGCVVSLALLHFGGQPPQRWFALPLAALGFAAVADLCLRSRSGVDRALAAWLLLPLPLIFYDHLPSKYLAPAVPAAAILIARALTTDWRRRVVTWALPALGAAISLLVISADARFAGLARSTAASLKGKRIWVDGLWGFNYYAQRAGAHLPSYPPLPGPRDRIIRSRFDNGWVERQPARDLVATLPGPTSWVHIMGHDAGFYSNSWGFWPFAIFRDSVDQYEVWEIRP